MDTGGPGTLWLDEAELVAVDISERDRTGRHKTGPMEIADLPVQDPRESISNERHDLLVLLDGLSDGHWIAASESGHWRVKDVALHLLDDNLGRLSRGRDGDLSGLLPTNGDYRDFVRSLNAKNERWVRAAEGLSQRVVVDGLRWSGAKSTTSTRRSTLKDPVASSGRRTGCHSGSTYAAI